METTLSLEERRESRFPVNSPATLHILSRPHTESVPVVVRNLSRNGARLECDQFLQHGTPVAIETKELAVVGTVENCPEIRTGLFGVGIKITELPAHPISSSDSK